MIHPGMKTKQEAITTGLTVLKHITFVWLVYYLLLITM